MTTNGTGALMFTYPVVALHSNLDRQSWLVPYKKALYNFLRHTQQSSLIQILGNIEDLCRPCQTDNFWEMFGYLFQEYFSCKIYKFFDISI